MTGDGAPAAPTRSGLRLRAEDIEDVAVISACVQDALVSVRDLAYDRAASRFMLVANRFRWERCGAGGLAPFERTLCGITFEAVESVSYRGFHRNEEDRILSLLAIQAFPGEAGGMTPGGMTPGGTTLGGTTLGGMALGGMALGGTTIEIEFARAATIRLSVAAIRCRLLDFGEPWPTAWQPGHHLEEKP